MEPSNFERRASTLVRLQNTQDYSQFKSESAGLVRDATLGNLNYRSQCRQLYCLKPPFVNNGGGGRQQ